MQMRSNVRLVGAALTVAAAISGSALFAAVGTQAASLAGNAGNLPDIQAGILVAEADATPAADASTPAPAAEAAPADHPVTYSNEQADRGKKKFESDCVECHGDDLRGGLNGGAPLRGSMFDQQFANGAPASGLFGFMSSAMPPNAPGRFNAETYADLMAYILKKNGYPAGAPLPSDIDALDHLLIEK